MCQVRCQVLVPLFSGVCHQVDHYGFASFIGGCTFGSARVCSAYRLSAEVCWSPIDDMYHWFPYNFADWHSPDLVEADIPSRKTDTSGMLGVDKLHAFCAVVWVVPTTGRFSQASAVAYMLLLSQGSLEDSDPRPVSPSITDAYDVDVDPEGECNSSDIPPSNKIDVHLSLWAGFSIIRDKCIEYSAEVQTMTSEVFKLELPSLDRYNRFSAEYRRMLRSLIRCMLKIAARDVSKVVYPSIIRFSGAIIATKAECDKNQVLADVEGQKRLDLEAILAGVRHYLNDHSSLPGSSHEMFP